MALTINPTVPSQPGTDNPATAPDITNTPLFYDGGAFGGPDLTADGGTGAQYYKFTPAEDGDYTFSVNWGSPSDVDVVLCTDVTCSDGGDFSGGGATTAQPEEPVYTLTGGTTYYIAVVLFAGVAPPWVSMNLH